MTPNVGLGTEGLVQRGWELWIVSVVMVIIAGLFVIARIAVRLSKRNLGNDDFTIVASLFAAVLLSITEIEAVENGYGRKSADIPYAQVIEARKWFYGAQLMYKIVPTLNKMSVVFLYHRIFAQSSLSFRWTCMIMQTMLIGQGLAFTIATIFQCRPIAAFWDRRGYPDATCFANEPWWISFSVVHIVSDIILLLLPAREIMRLNMSRVDKAGLFLIFATGLFVTFTSISRATTLASSASSLDPTWGPIPATIWAVVESNSGIICACLPTLRTPVLRLLRPIGLFAAEPLHDIESAQYSAGGKKSFGSLFSYSSRLTTRTKSSRMISHREIELDMKSNRHTEKSTIGRDSFERIIPPPSITFAPMLHHALARSRRPSLSSNDEGETEFPDTGWTGLGGGIHVQNDFEIASEARSSLVFDPRVPHRTQWMTTSITCGAGDAQQLDAEDTARLKTAEERRVKYGMTWE